VARITGTVCRFCRRAGVKLYLKGDKCISEKCPVSRRSYPPGEHGRRFTKETEYSVRLKEKQKARRIYGIMEKQFRIYYAKAARQRGVTGENLLRMLETRLDNVIYRLNLVSSRREARQMVSHGHVAVNGRRVDIPSYLVKKGDEITLTARGTNMFKERAVGEGELPLWLDLNEKTMKAKIKEIPNREDIPVDLKEQLIVEFYSK
jgi:small subunit ribosomal protein S4